jgi:hypothetical protein
MLFLVNKNYSVVFIFSSAVLFYFIKHLLFSQNGTTMITNYNQLPVNVSCSIAINSPAMVNTNYAPINVQCTCTHLSRDSYSEDCYNNNNNNLLVCDC